MKKLCYLLIMVGFLFNCSSSHREVISAKERPSKTITGSWQYFIFANGQKMGSSMLSVKKKKNSYVSYYEMTMNFGKTIVISKETIVESLKFVPMKYSYIQIVMNGKNVSRKKLSASFKDKKVTIKDKFSKRVKSFKKDFVLSNSRYFSAKHMDNNFETGKSIDIFVFDPSIDEDTLIPVSEEVVGKEIFKLKDEKIALIHIRQSIGKIKDVNNFVDSNGVLFLSNFTALNTKFKMVKR